MPNATLPVPKTFKLFIGGVFPRTESGRSIPLCRRPGAVVAHVCRASRKDFRNAVEEARAALPRWSGLSAYLRGQILHRIAEMLDGRRKEFVDAIATLGPARSLAGALVGRTQSIGPTAEVSACIDRLLSFAGWAQVHPEVLGHRCPVNGPYHVFSASEPTGASAIVCPDAPPLLAPITMLGAALAAGCTTVLLASETNPLPALLLGEVLATSDLPAGTVNILSGLREELVPVIAEHREIRAVVGADLDEATALRLRDGSAENLKRVSILAFGGKNAWLDHDSAVAPSRLEAFLEIKTVWHPSSV